MVAGEILNENYSNKFLIWMYVKIKQNPSYADTYIENRVKWLKSEKQKDKICAYIARLFKVAYDDIRLFWV